MRFDIKDPMQWYLFVFGGFVLALFIAALMKAEAGDEMQYKYQGWQSGTTLRSNTFSGTKAPQPNERLYIYRNGIKTGSYYEWNGNDWKPKSGAYFKRRKHNEEAATDNPGWAGNDCWSPGATLE